MVNSETKNRKPVTRNLNLEIFKSAILKSYITIHPAHPNLILPSAVPPLLCAKPPLKNYANSFTTLTIIWGFPKV